MKKVMPQKARGKAKVKVPEEVYELENKIKEFYNLVKKRQGLYKEIYNLTSKIEALEQSIISLGEEGYKVRKYINLVAAIVFEEPRISYKELSEEFKKRIVEKYPDDAKIINEIFKEIIQELKKPTKKVIAETRGKIEDILKKEEVLRRLY
ncbi:MAG: hypothetical protein QXL88_01660 [Candidatus Pacearchaeota archaeon]